ncbi:uncharacterized protein K444DRAFT_184376 [Hyaloscypha bicolor E]|uniref:Uncharacterized protein n=1 Tax=Hyaloscypha bicolor E TaxID=1095630 RepID=A0A2J6TRR1_9HELO|nr:uncharacterized protein K444DRAFT_184376 [Hyaloscypha bicolor E]PMD65648.1 hypothetical protein K444DRAFT_184376 [Hyaloscypha bicolor E]
MLARSTPVGALVAGPVLLKIRHLNGPLFLGPRKNSLNPPQETPNWIQQDIQRLAGQAPNTHQLHLHRPGRGVMPVLATFDPNTEGNWIASRIVKRLDFEHQQAKIHKDVPTFMGQNFERTRIFVDLTCGNQNRRHRCQHRFYVVNHCKVFDILLGTKLCP